MFGFALSIFRVAFLGDEYLWKKISENRSSVCLGFKREQKPL